MKNRTRAPRKQSPGGLGAARRRGFALVVVLFLALAMSMVTASLSVRTSGAYRLAVSRATSWRLYYAARNAIEEAKVDLWRQFVATKEPQGILAPPEPRKVQYEGVEVSVEFEDEAGKFPVNLFTSGEEGKRKELALALARLFESLALPFSTSLASSVQDYIDADEDGMRESRARNEAIFDVCELLALQGFTTEALYGRMKEDRPTAASCISAWHTGNINVNTAQPVVMMAFAPRLTQADVKAIIAARDEGPFSSMQDLTARAHVAGESLVDLARWSAFTTDTITIKAEAREGQFVRRVEAVAWFESTAAHTLYFREGWQNQGLAE